MISQKSHTKPHGGGWLKRELKFLGLFLGLISFSNIILSSNTFALFVPTLSASVDQANLQVNGNQVINSTDKTTEIPLNLIVNTNNKTGYTATINSETDETALVNSDSTNGAKINSISSAGALGDFSNNTWGVKIGGSINFSPIPKLTTPMSVIQTTGRTNGNETNNLGIGLKLGVNLESGNYKNKLIFSILTNNYERIALMTEGPDFNAKLKALETSTNKIEHFKKSPVAPSASINAMSIDDKESDYEIKLWLDPTEKTAYYYTEAEKVYLNANSNSMFYYMTSLTSLNLSDFDTSKVTNMNSMFSCTYSLTSINLSSFDTSNVTNMAGMFYYMNRLVSLDLSNFNTSNVTDMNYMFYYINRLTSLDLSGFDTSKVTNMSYMFSYMSSLTSLNLSNFDTSKVTNMGSMFSEMSRLTSLDLSNFDTSSVTNMGNMFSDVSRLTSLDLSGFNTSKVIDMRYMFYSMDNLTSLNLSSFDTSNVTNMSGMFSYVYGLTNLDLSNFNTSNVTDMSYMFNEMNNLTILDLSNFNTSKVTDMTSMFSLSDRNESGDKLEKIYVNNDFNTSELINYSEMFMNRRELRGGAGSYLTNPSAANKSWLRIDDPTNGRPGYFTRKP